MLVVSTHPYHWLRQLRQRRHERAFDEEDGRRFDSDFGVDTASLVKLRELDIPSPNWVHGVAYAATPAELFHELVGSLPIAYEDFVFVDFGSGKGRALLMASRYPFKAIVGVEFAPELHAIAVRNIRSYRNAQVRCHSIESVLADATDYIVPAEPLVCYFYNPFSAQILDRVLARLERSLDEHPRKLWVAFVSMRTRDVEAVDAPRQFTRPFDAYGFLQRVRATDRSCVYVSR